MPTHAEETRNKMEKAIKRIAAEKRAAAETRRVERRKQLREFDLTIEDQTIKFVERCKEEIDVAAKSGKNKVDVIAYEEEEICRRIEGKFTLLPYGIRSYDKIRRRIVLCAAEKLRTEYGYSVADHCRVDNYEYDDMPRTKYTPMLTISW